MAKIVPKYRPHKTTLGSYPFVNVVFSISIALFLIGLFGLLVLHATRLSEVIKEKIEIQVYLERNLAQEDRIKIGQLLAAKGYLDSSSGIQSIRFVSKDEAAAKFIAESGENFVRFLGENPLRDAFVLHIRNEMANNNNMRQIKLDLQQIKGVFEVEYVESLVSEVNKNISRIGAILLVFAAILLLTVVVLINNAVKIALFSQRFLIRSMQLVGAEPWFIQRPFVKRAAWQGSLSGIIASLLLMTLVQYSNANFPELRLLQKNESIAVLLFSIIALGCLICSTSTYVVVRRYLKLTLDELH